MTRQAGIIILWASLSVGLLTGCKMLPCHWSHLGPHFCTTSDERLKNPSPTEVPFPERTSQGESNRVATSGEVSRQGRGEPASPYHQIPPPWVDSHGEVTSDSVMTHRSVAYPDKLGGPPLSQLPPWLKADKITEVARKAEKPEAPPEAPSAAAPVTREPLVLALECFLNQQPGAAVGHLNAYDAQSQEVLLRVLPLVAQLTRKPLESLDPQETALLCEQFDGLLLNLRSRAELMIEKICYCDNVEGYGLYRPLPDNYTFRAKSEKGPGEQVQIYMQLRNPSCAKRGELFETRLATAVKIVDAHGKLWYYCDFKDHGEVIRSQAARRDFYLSYALYVPRIPAGRYRLVIEIKDRTNAGVERTARKELPFHVGL